MKKAKKDFAIFSVKNRKKSFFYLQKCTKLGIFFEQDAPDESESESDEGVGPNQKRSIHEHLLSVAMYRTQLFINRREKRNAKGLTQSGAHISRSIFNFF